MSSGYGVDLAAVHHHDFAEVAEQAAALVQTLVPAGLVVDLGSGSGVLARILTDAGYDVVGIELSPDMVALARQVAPKARFACQSLHAASLPDGCVAVTSIGECMNYLFDPAASIDGVLAKVRAALAPRRRLPVRPGRPRPRLIRHRPPHRRLRAHDARGGGQAAGHGLRRATP